MKKTILKISHFFGYRLNEQLDEDITIDLNSYPKIGITYYESYANSIKECPRWIIDDVIEKTYNLFKKDKHLEKRCKFANKVIVKFRRVIVKECITLIYSDDKLYLLDDKVIIRDKILNELLNEK